MASKMTTFVTDELLKLLISSAHSIQFEPAPLLTEQLSQSTAQKLQQVAKWYGAQQLVLVLGAGASVSYGLPDWDTLLQKLLLLTLKTHAADSKKGEDKAEILARTFTGIFAPSGLISARYLHNYFKKKQPKAKLAFETAIRDALYAGFKSTADSELMKEIRRFCIAAGLSPNLNAIITYNYDDLLEQCLSHIDVDIPFAPIYARGMKPLPKQLPIYHVHGYLPQKGTLTLRNKVVLSEEGYHQQYSDVYGWSNLIQINKFKDLNCLFIGVSFSDPNLRRLLDIAKNERGDDAIHHYCFKRRYSAAYVKTALEKLLAEHQDIFDEKTAAKLKLTEVVAELIKLMEKFEENDALSFGVGILWVDQYDEIPAMLKQIRISA